jgi:hypothetical protein
MSVGRYRNFALEDMAHSLKTAKFLLMRPLLSVVLCVGMAVCVLAQNPLQSGSDESWTITTSMTSPNVNPSRTTESHMKLGNRIVDRRKVEVLGINRGYEPFSETETEAVQVDRTTTRVVVRNYTWDGNGRKTLAQITEEESRTSAGGVTRTECKTSRSDLNGNFKIVQRETTDTRKINADVEETKTSIYRADSYGGFTQVQRTEELKTHKADNSIALKTTSRVPDGNGTWRVTDVTEKVITDDGKNGTTDERFSATDPEDRLYETSRKVSKEGETATGEKKRTEEIYSHVSAAGYSDSSMHLNERVTTI